MMANRRDFLAALTAGAFSGIALAACAPARRRAADDKVRGYGPLRSDPKRLLDLPEGFSYRAISHLDERMSDGLPVPDRADGMGAFALDARRMILVRNHEIGARHHRDGPFRHATPASVLAYDHDDRGRPLPGGTTTILYDYVSHRVERQFLSLVGTIRNCAGGTTPWGTWLSCEEDVTRAGNRVQRDHGWVFEVPANAAAPVAPIPLKAMGRFNHEAAAVDPGTGVVYLTEDRDDSLFYRFLPNSRGELGKGGRLQALALAGTDEPADSRNWKRLRWPLQHRFNVRWLDLEDVESPGDDLRLQGHAKGAALFARGEGVHFGNGELYFCCTSGGAVKHGQIMRYRPSPFEGSVLERTAAGTIEVFVESTSPALLDFGDNLTVAPNGHLIVCEDQYGFRDRNHLRGVTPSGMLYDLAFLRVQTELAGACFSPDGRTLFVNVYSPTRTLAIQGPWDRFRF